MTAKYNRRILLVAPMPPAVGGISVSCSRLRDRLVKDGYDVDTYDMQTSASGIRRSYALLKSTLKLPFFIARHKKKYDLIHFNISSYWRQIYMWMMQPLFNSVKSVVTFHHDISETVRRPLSSVFLRMGDRFICVRKGNLSLLPKKMQRNAVEIPAFILPVFDENNCLPELVNEFIKNAESRHLPLVVFNGGVVLNKPHFDLYGFGDMTESALRCYDDGLKFALLMIINNHVLDAAQLKFVSEIKGRFSRTRDVLICDSRGISLISVFAHSNVIYVRPTKTDGDSLSVREALALGVPVIASDVSPRPDNTILYDHNNGYLGLFNALSDILKDYGVIGEREQIVSEDFYDKILAVYKSLFA